MILRRHRGAGQSASADSLSDVDGNAPAAEFPDGVGPDDGRSGGATAVGAP